MNLLRWIGAILRTAGNVVIGAFLVLVLLFMADVAFSGLGLIDRIATALLGQGVFGYYGMAAGVTMLALTGTKFWQAVGFSHEALRDRDLVGALGAIAGRGFSRGIGTFFEIVFGGLLWPVTLIAWYGKRSDDRGRERLTVLREYHALRAEIEAAREGGEEDRTDGETREVRLPD